jgi:hypothetical protein
MNLWRSIFGSRAGYDALPETELASGASRDFQLEISDIETALVSCLLRMRAFTVAANRLPGMTTRLCLHVTYQANLHTQLSVKGMTCGACSASVENALR